MPLSQPPLPPFPWADIPIILALVALNGLFAMSELAIVSARKPRLRAMASAGHRAARRTALELADRIAGRFLSTTQIGITLIGIIAGAYSGATLSEPTALRLERLGLGTETARTAAYALVIGLTTFAAIIIGELVPKQFALRRPEPIAAVMGLPMLWLSRATAPLGWLLDRTSALIFRVLGLKRESESQVTAEELRLIVAEAQVAGVIEESEHAIISGVMRLADRPVREVMTPRTDVDWIDLTAGEDVWRARLVATPHTRVLVAEGSVDAIVGVVQARDLVAAMLAGQPLDLRALMREAPVIPDVMESMDALEALRAAEVPVALVHDEYGHFEGLVTPADLLAAIAGDFASDQDLGTDPPLVERADGSWLISGSLAADTLAERLGVDLPEDRDYATAAGFALSLLRHIPETGECFEQDDWRFEIVDMDGRKIDKLLAWRIAAETADAGK